MHHNQSFRVLIVDADSDSHECLRKILIRRSDRDQVDRAEQTLFDEPRVATDELPVFEVESAFSADEAIKKISATSEINFLKSSSRLNQPELGREQPTTYSVAFLDAGTRPATAGLMIAKRLLERSSNLPVVLYGSTDPNSGLSWEYLIRQIGWTDRLYFLSKPFQRMEVSQLALALSLKHQQCWQHAQLTSQLRSAFAKQTIELEKEILRRQRAETILRENPTQVFDHSEVDSVTGLFNRKAVLQRIKFIASDADAQGSVYSILFVDIDRMQSVNLDYGEMAGDVVLKNVALRLKETLDPNDVIGRYGGEEFIIGLRNCPQEQALNVAERLRDRVAHSTIRIDGYKLQVTVSVGVASQDVRLHAMTEQVLACADLALGQAKSNGRNRVESQMV